MSEFSFPFRRMTKFLKLPVSGTASNFEVPAGYIRPDYTAFCVVNANSCYVALRGTSMPDGGPTPTMATPAADDDWPYPPHHFGVYTTQYPMFMSTLAFAVPDFPLPSEFVPLRIAYGYGA